VIEISHIKKSFGKLVALDGVTLSIAPGERIGFVGPNGSGKTTLLRAILGLVRVEGRILIGGVDVAREPEIALRTTAYIPQIAPPLEAPVSEVVRAQAALREIDTAEIASCGKALGLDVAALAHSRFKDLSGGTKQKLLAAMALATRAPILVCDEPTANLDADSRAAFFARVSERPEKSIVLLCSHRTEEIRRMVDRVIELDEGRVVSDHAIHRADLAASRLRLVSAS
jgi:ABC-type multidrug transport system ATPase subunit